MAAPSQAPQHPGLRLAFARRKRPVRLRLGAPFGSFGQALKARSKIVGCLLRRTSRPSRLRLEGAGSRHGMPPGGVAANQVTGARKVAPRMSSSQRLRRPRSAPSWRLASAPNCGPKWCAPWVRFRAAFFRLPMYEVEEQDRGMFASLPSPPSRLRLESNRVPGSAEALAVTLWAPR